MMHDVPEKAYPPPPPTHTHTHTLIHPVSFFSQLTEFGGNGLLGVRAKGVVVQGPGPRLGHATALHRQGLDRRAPLKLTGIRTQYLVKLKLFARVSEK